MASGRLAGLDLTTANTDQQLYACPGSKVACATVSLCNRNNSTSLVRLALCTTTSPATTDYLVFDQAIPANESLERAGIVLAAGQYLYVRTNQSGVSAVAFGYEETPS